MLVQQFTEWYKFNERQFCNQAIHNYRRYSAPHILRIRKRDYHDIALRMLGQNTFMIYLVQSEPNIIIIHLYLYPSRYCHCLNPEMKSTPTVRERFWYQNYSTIHFSLSVYFIHCLLYRTCKQKEHVLECTIVGVHLCVQMQRCRGLVLLPRLPILQRGKDFEFAHRNWSKCTLISRTRWSN